VSDLNADGLRDMILAYSNRISELKLEVENLERSKRNLEMQMTKLAPVTVLPYKGPREPLPPAARCHKCGAKTRDRANTITGFLVAECAECQLETFSTNFLATKRRSASDHSPAEQNVGS